MDNDTERKDEFIVNNPDDVNPLYRMKQNEKLRHDVSEDTPFSEPSDIEEEININNQIFDSESNIDSHEEYDAGSDIASGAKS